MQNCLHHLTQSFSVLWRFWGNQRSTESWLQRSPWRTLCHSRWRAAASTSRGPTSLEDRSSLRGIKSLLADWSWIRNGSTTCFQWTFSKRRVVGLIHKPCRQCYTVPVLSCACGSLLLLLGMQTIVIEICEWEKTNQIYSTQSVRHCMGSSWGPATAISVV